MVPRRPQLKLIRSLWGVVVQEPNVLDPLLLSRSSASPNTDPAAPVQSKFIPSTLDHKLFPSRQAFFQHLKTNGFAGVEASLTDLGATRAERQAYARALSDAGLDLVCGVYSSWQVGIEKRGMVICPPSKEMGKRLTRRRPPTCVRI